LDLETGKETRRLTHKGRPLGVFPVGLSFSPKGDLVVMASNKHIYGWDPATGDERFLFEDSSDVRTLSEVFEDGTKIASANDWGGIKIWSIPDGKFQTLIEKGGADKISRMCVSPDGKRLIAQDILRFTVWDLASAKTGRVIESGAGVFSSAHF